eukprot:TRINITY_DN10172_c0_g1_i2.p1 TRINITY_DN10172_c0_g1~~TRINITY_DN10172_c0_g1_i2.p1  ORF type:complete len:250 (+),score=85.23 TRINITY_DN10172_c0_g1_i2:59-808(+)
MDRIDRSAEFFDFHPSSFVEEVGQMVSDVVAEGADIMEQTILQKISESNGEQDPTSAHIVAEGLNSYVATLQKSVNKNLDRFDLYVMKNIFQVPEEVLNAAGEDEQREYLALLQAISEDEELQKEIAELQRDIDETRTGNMSLLKEIENIDKDLDTFRSKAIPQLNGIQEACQAHSVGLEEAEGQLAELVKDCDVLKESATKTAQIVKDMSLTAPSTSDVMDRLAQHRQKFGNPSDDELTRILEAKGDS